jgi:7-keto-8-aminopelargonate synthetase-like enzyme
VYGLSDERIVITASLAKSLGASGGMIAGSAERVARVRREAAPYIASTALNPGSTAAALAAVGILAREPQRVERLTANTGALHRMARRLGLVPRGTFLPVLRLGVDQAEASARGQTPGATLVALQRALRVAGVFAPVIDYPGQAAAQLRVTVCSEHTSDDLAQLEAVLAEHLPPLVRAT